VQAQCDVWGLRPAVPVEVVVPLTGKAPPCRSARAKRLAVLYELSDIDGQRIIVRVEPGQGSLRHAQAGASLVPHVALHSVATW
jgi:hypothetical protein